MSDRPSNPMSIEELRLRTKLGGVSREDLLAEIERLTQQRDAANTQLAKTLDGSTAVLAKCDRLRAALMRIDGVLPLLYCRVQIHAVVCEALGAAHETPAVNASVSSSKCEHDLQVAGNSIVVTDEGKRAVCVYCGFEWRMPPDKTSAVNQMMQPCRRGCGELVHLENDGFHVCRAQVVMFLGVEGGAAKVRISDREGTRDILVTPYTAFTLAAENGEGSHG